VSTFARRFAVTLDGQRFELTSRPSDFLAAERALGREKITNPAETAPMQLQFRIVYAMWGRSFPEHPAARDWTKFLELVDEVEDLDAGEAGELLDPTRPEESASSP
jgi:hypothetical protein